MSQTATQKNTKKGFQECKSNVLQSAAVPLTCINLPHGFKTFALSIFEWPIKKCFTVSIIFKPLLEYAVRYKLTPNIVSTSCVGDI